MASKKCKLNWNVAREEDGSIKRRHTEGDEFGVNHIDVEWTHEDGFNPDYKVMPVNLQDARLAMTSLLRHALEEQIISKEQADKMAACMDEVVAPHRTMLEVGEIVVSGECREVIQDQLSVSHDVTDSTIMQMLDAKRPALAQAIGVDP